MSKIVVDPFDCNKIVFNFLFYIDDARRNVTQDLIRCVNLLQQLAKNLLDSGLPSPNILIMVGGM